MLPIRSGGQLWNAWKGNGLACLMPHREEWRVEGDVGIVMLRTAAPEVLKDVRRLTNSV